MPNQKHGGIGERLIADLEDLSKSFESQGDRFEVDGHEIEAREMYGRSFGVDRAITLARQHLETRK